MYCENCSKPVSNDPELRLKCLKLSVKLSISENPGATVDIIRRAAGFYNFVTKHD